MSVVAATLPRFQNALSGFAVVNNKQGKSTVCQWSTNNKNNKYNVIVGNKNINLLRINQHLETLTLIVIDCSYSNIINLVNLCRLKHLDVVLHSRLYGSFVQIYLPECLERFNVDNCSSHLSINVLPYIGLPTYYQRNNVCPSLKHVCFNTSITCVNVFVRKPTTTQFCKVVGCKKRGLCLDHT